MNDLSRLAEIAQNHYFTLMMRKFGAEGASVLRKFLPHLKTVLNVIDYESISESLTVVYRFDDGVLGVTDLPYVLEEPSQLALHNYGTLTVEVLVDGRFRVWKRSHDLDVISPGAIVYRYRPESDERVWVDGVEGEVPATMAYTRIFGLSRFKDLAQCLDHYAVRMARSSECRILAAVWREEGRVMWLPGPEDQMRFSLYQHLKSSLREGNPDITQETPVDHKNPIDITVRWANSNKIGLIEIKWLGKSGKLNPPKKTKEWSEQRARDGLSQLADYLDRTRDRAGTFDRRGFLVVYDGRRAMVKDDTVSVSREDGLKYQDAHIAYPQDLLDRHDIATPVRCFCEPNFNAGVSPSRNH
ncbi:hypothetical protein [Streptomyces sp. NPDC058683]|uniref:hypothetical protein n=1 Tax=Streptomyces sp. NPDC058683 TaxID=3346597 RepID=UPI003656832E